MKKVRLLIEIDKYTLQDIKDGFAYTRIREMSDAISNGIPSVDWTGEFMPPKYIFTGKKGELKAGEEE